MKPRLRTLIIVLVALLAILLIGPFLIPIPPLEGTVPPRELAVPNSQFIEVEGIEVHYQSYGQGEPTFFLLHGFGASLFSWREVFEPLSQMGTVIAYDRPAFGLTERPMPEEWQGENPYSPDFQIRLTIAFMDQLGIDRAILIGNSAGGTHALLTYFTNPERVEALILVDPAVYTGGAPGWIKPLLKTPQMRRLGILIARAFINRGESLIDMAWHDPTRLTPQAIELYKIPLKAENWDRALWEFTLASHDPDLASRLDQVIVPTLVITGDDDRIVPTEESIHLAQELPNAKLVVIPDCGHVPQEECPIPFMQAVATFVAEITH
jgi:pimeloyl-ACP methyl ester carboxylesterase